MFVCLQSPRRQSDMGPRRSSSSGVLPPIRRNTMTSTSLGSESSEPSSPNAYPNHALFSIGEGQGNTVVEAGRNGTCIAMWILRVYSKWSTYVKVLFVCLVSFFFLNLFKRQIIFMKMFFHIAFKFSALFWLIYGMQKSNSVAYSTGIFIFRRF